jgi:hypothetical protein
LKNFKSLFEKPSAQSRPWTIWIWNSCISKEKLVDQLTSFIEKGFGGVAIKPSRDMSPAYLSKEFLDLFECALQVAEKEHIGIRLAEDFSMPWNGIFESITNQDKRLRGRCLHLEHTELLPDRKNFEKQINDPKNTIMLASKLINGKLALAHLKQLSIPSGKDVLAWKSTQGDWQLMIFRKADVADPIAGFVPNVFHPQAAEWYINNVGEVFRKTFSKYLRKTFMGFILEMPAYIVPGENTLPWDDDLAIKFQSRYRKKLTDLLPALFFNSDGEFAKNRQILFSFINQIIHERFTITLEKWCEKNHLSQWVLCPERSLQRSNPAVKYFETVPTQGAFASIGIQNQDGCEENYPLLRFVSDMNSLHFRRETITVLGRNRLGMGATLQQLKAEVDRSILNGPSTLCLDGCFFTLDRRSYLKTPHNPSWYSPNWIHMKSFCDYTARANEITKQSRILRQAAVLMPFEAMLSDYILGFPEPMQKATTLFQETLKELERLDLGFDIINEEVLVSCSVFSNGEFGHSNRIRKGNYRVLIIPFSRLISMPVLAFIEKMAQKNGRIIFIEDAPQGTQQEGGTTAFNARIKKLLQSKKGNVRVSPLKELETQCAAITASLSITVLGKKCPDIFSSQGSADGMEILSLHNISESQDYFVTVDMPEQKNVYSADCSTSELIELQDVQRKDKRCRFNLTFLPKQTYFIITSAQKLSSTPIAKNKKPLISITGTLQRSYCIVLKDQWQFSPASLNILPLANWNTRIGLSRESGGYSLFYEAYFEIKDIPEICILSLGGLIGGTPYQLCSTAEKPMEVTINGARADEIVLSKDTPRAAALPTEAQNEANTLPLSPLINNLFGNNTYLYAIKDQIRKGINRISLRTLGLVFDPLAIVYPPVIAGSFSIIKGSAGWIVSAMTPVIGHDSWTKYGYPYLCGTGVYKQIFELPGEYNRLVLRFSRVSDTIDVAVNDKPLGILNWHPLEFDITDLCESRRNELTVRIVNTLDNLLRMTSRPSGLLGEVFVDVY